MASKEEASSVSEAQFVDLSQLFLPEDIENSYAGFHVIDAPSINVLLVGRTGVGKSTLINTLKNPTSGVASKMFSVTRVAAVHHFALRDEKNNNTYQLNIIDTPGLKVNSESPKNNRTDAQLLELAAWCIRKSITELNLICFVAKACNTHDKDKEIFEDLMNFCGPDFKKHSMLVLTNCETFTEEKTALLIAELKSADSWKNIVEFCSLGIYTLGSHNSDLITGMKGKTTAQLDMIDATVSKLRPMREKFLNALIEAKNCKLPVPQIQHIGIMLKNESSGYCCIQ